ncbi:MAG: LysE family transporter [Anaerolineales bacterium]|jgi:threonine/homoserine/homoserine lactone efflux protein
MTHPFWAGILAGYGIAIPVGAIAILIVNVALRCGFQVGFLAGAGAAAVDLLYASLAVIAGSAIVVALEPISTQLRILSGVVLLGLALYGLWRGLAGSHAGSEVIGACNPARTFWQFLLLTLINPMTVVYFTALILGMDPGQEILWIDKIAFISGAAIASLSWQTLLAGLGSLGKEHLSESFQRLAVIAGNLIIFVLGVLILVRALQ